MPHQLARQHGRYRAVGFGGLLNARSAGRVAGKAITAIGKRIKQEWKKGEHSNHSAKRRVNRGSRNPNAVGTKSGAGITGGRKTIHQLKKGKKCLANWDVTTVGYTNITCPAGVQAHTDLFVSGNRDDFLVGSSLQPPLGNGQVFSYFALNPNQATTGSAAVGQTDASKGLLPSIPTNDRILLKSYDYTIKLTNTESIETTVTLYCYMWKQNWANLLDATWANALTSEANGQFGSADPAPGNYQVNARQGNSDPGQWGQSPFQNKDVRKQIKLLKTFKFTMASGSTEEIHYNVKLDKVVDREYMANLASTDNLVRGVTVGWYAIAHSQAVIDKTGGAHVGTLGSSEIASVWRTRTRLGSLKAMAQRIDVNRQYTQVPYNTTLANQYAVNEQDVVAPVVQA